MRGRAGSEVKLSDALVSPSQQSERLAETGEKAQHGTEASETRAERGTKSKGTAEEEEYGFDGVPGDNSLNVFGDKQEVPESTDVEDENIKNLKELTMKLEDAMTKINELTEANEKLSSQVLDQAGLDSLVEDRMQLIDACSKLVNGIEYTGKSNLDLKKEVLLTKMPKVSLEDKSVDYINAAFDVMKSSINDTTEGSHDTDTYGEDLSLEDTDGVEKVETPEGESKPVETTKNVHEGENPDEGGEEGKNDEPDEDVKVKDSVSVLDSAFVTEIKQVKVSKEMSPYEKYCAESREAWKK